MAHRHIWYIRHGCTCPRSWRFMFGNIGKITKSAFTSQVKLVKNKVRKKNGEILPLSFRQTRKQENKNMKGMAPIKHTRFVFLCRKPSLNMLVFHYWVCVVSDISEVSGGHTFMCWLHGHRTYRNVRNEHLTNAELWKYKQTSLAPRTKRSHNAM